MNLIEGKAIDFCCTRTISGLLISGGYGNVEVQDWFNDQQHCKVLDLPEERFSHTQVLEDEELKDNFCD